MKTYTFLLLIVSNIICFGQKRYKNIDFKNKSENTLPIYKQLGIVDSMSLIVSIGIFGGIPPQNQSFYIAYHSNRKIDVFSVTNKSSNEQTIETTTKRVEINSVSRKVLRSFLKVNLKNNYFNLDPSKLNIQEIDREEKEPDVLEVSDGITYFIQVIQLNKYSTYSSYSPYKYIQASFPGSTERQKLLQVYEGYYKLVSPFFK